MTTAPAASLRAPTSIRTVTSPLTLRRALSLPLSSPAGEGWEEEADSAAKLAVLRKVGSVRTMRTGLLLGFLVCGIGARGQSVLTPPPPVSVTPPALAEFQSSELGVVQRVEESTGIPLGTLPFQWGPVNLRPQLFYSLSYASGLLSTPGAPASSIVNQFSPGMLFTIGSHWTIDYTPTWRWYSSSQFHDSLDHSLALNGWSAYEDWTFGLSQTYGRSSGSLAQTGTQTEQESFGTALNSSYRFNSKVSLDLSLSQNLQSADQFQGYRQWSTMEFLNYQFWPRFTAGLGVGAGYVDVDVGANMAFEQFQGRISWLATGKTSLVFHGGLEYRQFLSGGVNPILNPIFGLSLQTLLAKKTSLSIGADRGVSASYFANQASESTTVSVSLSQGITSRLNFGVSGSYGTTSYSSSALGVAASGGYDYISLSTRLSYYPIKRVTVSATYQFSNNSSSQPGLSFQSNQIGLELSYNF